MMQHVQSSLTPVFLPDTANVDTETYHFLESSADKLPEKKLRRTSMVISWLHMEHCPHSVALVHAVAEYSATNLQDRQ